MASGAAKLVAVIVSCTSLFLLLAIFFLICFWFIFYRAGKPGWTSIIPIYNLVVLLNIVGMPAWWVLLFLVPVVNVVLLVMVFHRLSKSFGYGRGFTIGLILLPFIFFPILAFGRSQYTLPVRTVTGAV